MALFPKKIILHHKYRYFRYFHHPNTIVFIILSAIRQAKFHARGIIIGTITLLSMLFILQLAFTASSAVHQKYTVNKLARKGNFNNNGARDVEFGCWYLYAKYRIHSNSSALCVSKT